MDFERGIDVKKALDIGLSKRHPEVGDRIYVRFQMRLSCPEYYPLQKEEKEGKYQLGTVVETHHEDFLVSEQFGAIKVVLDVFKEDNNPYYATWNDQGKYWSIY